MEMQVTVAVFLFLSLFGLNTGLYRKHYYVNDEKDWSHAQDYCRKKHYDLSTASYEELIKLSANPQVTSDKYWIGLYVDYHIWSVSWSYRWSGGGEYATDLEWDGGQPKYRIYDSCGSVKTSCSKLHDDVCSHTEPFYCMDVFELILVKQESTWEEAVQYCRQNYIDLADLSSDVIMAEAKDKSTPALTDDVWIGLRFIAGHWFWVNGEDLDYKVWSGGGELQCPAMDQRCGVYDRTQNAWKPTDCERRLNFLCVKKL